VGAARARRGRATPIRTRRTGLLDTCGTGGDQLHTFNISTATALVAAAAGVPVAKHGNRSVSSCSGSADVLEALGVNVQLSPERVGACLDEVGIGFCFAPLLHGSMKHAAPVRKQLGFRTIFNLLGPLTNPAGAEYQLVGANCIENAEKLAPALAQLGRRHALVVCGAGALDEVSLWGETLVYEVAGGEVAAHRWTAATFGFPECDVSALRVRSPAESADVIRRILEGAAGPHREIVIVNAAAALIAAGRSEHPRDAAALAAEAIDSGNAAELCRRLVEFTNQGE
jgi:anthranilate phosphoribosyltransferase